MAKLTIKELESLRTTNIGETIRDEGGLVGKVRAGRDESKPVSITFYYRFRWVGSSKDFACGTWPATSLADVRRNRDKARQLVAAGVNPIDAKKAGRIEAQNSVAATIAAEEQRIAESKTVRDLFDAWFPTVTVKRGRKGRVDGGAEIKRQFEKDFLPACGSTLLPLITATEVRKAAQAVSDRGANRLAVLMIRDVKQMFRWGDKNRPWKKLLVDSDVLSIDDVDVVAGDYDPVRDNERERALSESEIQALAELLPKSGLPFHSQAAVWIMLSTVARVGETVSARRENVDLAAKTWFIPAADTKTKQAITIALSDFAASWFERLIAALDDDDEWVFPSRVKTKKGEGHMGSAAIGKQLKDRQVDKEKRLKGRTEDFDALKLSGGQWKCHDLRRTGCTLMQSLGIDPEIIHRCENHARKEKLDRVYLQYDYKKEMAHAWSVLGERLAELTASVYVFDAL